MRKLNNKGYLLIEIILASALAIAMSYTMIELTIKLKNKNDDLLVKSLTSTDQGIIYNYFMKKIAYGENIDCSKINYNNKLLSYNGDNIIQLNKYAEIRLNPSAHTSSYCLIPINVKNLEDENFDVIVYLNE